MIDVDAAMDYLQFVEARHTAWVARQTGMDSPWTDDPIVNSRKFTNVFRILDHGTQFVLTDLEDPEVSDRDLLMRLFLYRHTGRTEVWEFLELMLGAYPTVSELDEVLDIWRAYRGDAHVRTRNVDPRSAGRTTQTDFKRSVFTSAYLVFPQSQVKGTDKLESIIRLTQRLFTPDSPNDVMPDFMAAQTQAERFAALRRNKGVADFMSMQILTDWGYTSHCGVDRENEFVVPGPGARKGAAALAPGVKAEVVIDWAVEAIRSLPNCPRLQLPGGQVREPSYMDAQNTLCEFSKYVRYQDKPASKPYVPAHPGPQPEPVLPEHW